MKEKIIASPCLERSSSSPNVCGFENWKLNQTRRPTLALVSHTNIHTESCFFHPFSVNKVLGLTSYTCRRLILADPESDLRPQTLNWLSMGCKNTKLTPNQWLCQSPTYSEGVRFQCHEARGLARNPCSRLAERDLSVVSSHGDSNYCSGCLCVGRILQRQNKKPQQTLLPCLPSLLMLFIDLFIRQTQSQCVCVCACMCMCVCVCVCVCVSVCVCVCYSSKESNKAEKQLRFWWSIKSEVIWLKDTITCSTGRLTRLWTFPELFNTCLNVNERQIRWFRRMGWMPRTEHGEFWFQKSAKVN